MQYVYSNYTGNFIGFAIGMASTRLVAHFFTTRSISFDPGRSSVLAVSQIAFKSFKLSMILKFNGQFLFNAVYLHSYIACA